MPTDTAIENDIRGALTRDPRLPAPEQVAIFAAEGAVVLRGTVGSFRERRAAVSDARNVPGVHDVDDQLQVRLLDAGRRADAELRGAALEALHRSPDVPEELVDVKASDGWLTLTGQVGFQDESDAAYNAVGDLTGVVAIINEIEVIP